MIAVNIVSWNICFSYTCIGSALWSTVNWFFLLWVVVKIKAQVIHLKATVPVISRFHDTSSTLNLSKIMWEWSVFFPHKYTHKEYIIDCEQHTFCRVVSKMEAISYICVNIRIKWISACTEVFVTIFTLRGGW